LCSNSLWLHNSEDGRGTRGVSSSLYFFTEWRVNAELTNKMMPEHPKSGHVVTGITWTLLSTTGSSMRLTVKLNIKAIISAYWGASYWREAEREGNIYSKCQNQWIFWNQKWMWNHLYVWCIPIPVKASWVAGDGTWTINFALELCLSYLTRLRVAQWCEKATDAAELAVGCSNWKFRGRHWWRTKVGTLLKVLLCRRASSLCISLHP
jgi:hypothetical protein